MRLRSILMNTSAMLAPADRPGGTGVNARLAADEQPDELELPDDEPEPEVDDPSLEPESDDEPAPEGDETEGDGEPDPNEGREPPPAQRTRGQERIERLQERTRVAEQTARDTLARLNELEQRVNRPALPQETPQQEAERLAIMTPEERADYKMNRALSAHVQRTDTLLFNLQDTSDRAAFQAKLASDPRFKKYEAEVESRLATIRKQNTNLPREAILIYLLGEKIMNNGKPPKPQRDAEGRVNRQRVQPGNNRGDVQGQRRAAGTSIEKRLENVPI